MSDIPEITVRAGGLAGRAFFDPAIESFVAVVQLFEPGSTYPPPCTRHGTRFGEFITIDALANHLAGCGLTLDEGSLHDLCLLSECTRNTHGSAEFVGLYDEVLGHRLVLSTPSGGLVRIRPHLDHADYRVCWGDVSPAVVETARLLCDLAWAKRPNHDVDGFALALTYEFLADFNGDFSFDASSLCDWFLTDSLPTTGLTDDDRRTVRNRLDPMRVHPSAVP